MTLRQFLDEWNSPSPTISVTTSGSTGTPKVMAAEKRRMEASARITCRFLGLRPGNTALLCLPLDYIAGKMMVVRALTCGLRLIDTEPSSHPMAKVTEDIDFAAMVPLQVAKTLDVEQERERLMRVRHLIIGGGAVDAALTKELKEFPQAVWSTYGMTETLSHIALRRLNGPEASEWYTPFEGVCLSVDSVGCLVIDAPAVCATPIATHDIAELRPDGCFRIVGRTDNVVCSGGVKIQIEEAEQRLGTVLASPFCLTWRSDPALGQALVMLTTSADTLTMRQACHSALPRLWQPRLFLTVAQLPMTPNGKIARKEAHLIAEGYNSKNT